MKNSDWTPPRIRAISGLRAHLESYAARHAAMQSSQKPAQVMALKQALNRLAQSVKSRDYPAFEQADYQLHATIISMANVPLLHESWLPVWKGLLKLHRESFSECWPDMGVLTQEHVHLVSDILRGDAGAAEVTARAHVEAVWYRYDEMSRNHKDGDPLQRATAYIAFRMALPLTLDEVASKAACVSSGHLSRLLKAEYGESFQKYVQNIRLEKAAELLQCSSLSIKEIANRVGYQDLSRFGQHFKRRYQLTPRHYRNAAAHTLD